MWATQEHMTYKKKRKPHVVKTGYSPTSAARRVYYCIFAKPTPVRKGSILRG